MPDVAGEGERFDFGRLEIKGKTATIKLPMLWPDATLTGKPALEVNAAYYGARMRGSSQRVASPELAIPMAREEDIELFARHVLVGWTGIRNAKGELVPFSYGAAKAVLAQIPAWLFDQIRYFFARAESFIEQGGMAAPGSAEALAGKSTTG